MATWCKVTTKYGNSYINVDNVALLTPAVDPQGNAALGGCLVHTTAGIVPFPASADALYKMLKGEPATPASALIGGGT